MQNPLFDNLKYGLKVFKKSFFFIEIWTFSFQICFQNHFSTLGICKYMYLRIFSVTTSQSWKFIPKADLEWKCPYFYSKIFFEWVHSIFQKVKKLISHCIFIKWLCRGRVYFWVKIFSEKAKLPEICLSLSGNMPEAKIWKVFDNPW